MSHMHQTTQGDKAVMEDLTIVFLSITAVVAIINAIVVYFLFRKWRTQP